MQPESKRRRPHLNQPNNEVMVVTMSSLSVQAAAEALDICPGSVYNLIKRGRLHAMRVDGRTAVPAIEVEELRMGERFMRCPPNAALPTLVQLSAIQTDECVVWPYTRDQFGYGTISINGRNTRTHIFTCTDAHGPKPPGSEVAHSCRNPSCVNPRHLRWATPSENARDRILHDTWTRGERHGGAKLTDAKVVAIRASYAAGSTQSSIATQFGVSPNCVSTIVTYKHWKHLPKLVNT